MNRFSDLRATINVGSNSQQGNILLRVPVKTTETLSIEDGNSLDRFFQQLFELVVKNQEGNHFSFLNMNDQICPDDLENEIFNGKVRLLNIAPINEKNVKISFSGGDDLPQYYADIIKGGILESFLLHLLYLSALEEVLQATDDAKRSDVFQEARMYLRGACADRVRTNNQFNDELIGIYTAKHENFHGFQPCIDNIKKIVLS